MKKILIKQNVRVSINEVIVHQVFALKKKGGRRVVKTELDLKKRENKREGKTC